MCNNLPRILRFSIRHRGIRCLGGVFAGICVGSIMRQGGLQGISRVSALMSVLTSTVKTPAGPAGVSGAFGDRQNVGCDGGAVSGRVSCLIRTFLVSGTSECSVGNEGCIKTGLGCCFSSIKLEGTELGFERRRPARVVRGVICGRLLVENCGISINVMRTCTGGSRKGAAQGRFRISFMIGRNDRECCVRITCSVASRRGRGRRFGSFEGVPSSFGGVIMMGKAGGP